LSPFKAFDPDDATVSLKPPTVITQMTRVSTQSKRITSNNTQESKQFIPTLRQFLDVDDDENDSRRLVGDNNRHKVETLAKWPTSFLLHPEVFACLGGAALIIIRAIIQE
jgi:hypothetical protein